MFLLLALGVLGLVLTGLGYLVRQQAQYAEWVLPVILLGGIIALIAALGGLVILLSAFDLTDKRAALGMPEGSIRAVIALMLILLFTIMGIYIYASLRFTEEAFLSLAATNDQAAETLRASEDLARQLLTTVGTLVVALASFYFGSNTLAPFTGAPAAAAKSIAITNPTSPAVLEMKRDARLSGIQVTTVPPNQPIEWEIEGDTGGRLVQEGPGVFSYTRGPDEQPRTVILRFRLVDRPDVTAQLRIDPPG